MVKPLTFKGEKKAKKRKHHEVSHSSADDKHNPSAPVDPNEDDSWTSLANPSELTGPTVIVLPTRPPTCLASDPNGNVYASQIENMVEGDAKTAEPHSVQQVWVASRVAGMAANEISLKGSHGGYLSCDQYGILGAKREARGGEESFSIDASTDEDGRTCYRLRTAATKNKSKTEELRYISATVEASAKNDPEDSEDSARRKIAISLRGDGEATSEATHILLRMQTRFRPQSAAEKEAGRAGEKISRHQLETDAGRRLTDVEAKMLKKAKRDGHYGEAVLDVRAKGKHDKYA